MRAVWQHIFALACCYWCCCWRGGRADDEVSKPTVVLRMEEEFEPLSLPATTSLEDLDDEAYNNTSTRSLHGLKKRALPLVAYPLIPMIAPPPLLPPPPQRVIKEYFCPDGMALIGKDCVGRHILSPTRFCPPFSRLMGEECVAKARPTVECPVGFALRRGLCITVDVFPADLTCPDPDETLDPANGGCCERLIPEPPTCPPGFLFTEAGDCQQALPSLLECPPAYRLPHPTVRQCVRTIRVDAAILCPEGSVLTPETGKCTILRQDSPRCPPRFMFDGGRCVRAVRPVPAPCPTGFARVGTMCEQTETTPAEPFCLPDFALLTTADPVAGGPMAPPVCMRETPVPPKCPPAFQFARDAAPGTLCEKIVPEVPVCPTGTVPRHVGPTITCERIVEHDLTQCCPPGFELLGDHCQRVETVPARLSCSNECYLVRRTPLAYTCPDGTRFTDHPLAPKCVREVAPATCTDPPESCNPAAGPGGILRAEDVRNRQECAAQPVCSAPRLEAVVAQPYCPEGGTVENSSCVMKEPIIPEKICDIGELDPQTDQCVRTVTAPPRSECPPGTLRDGMRCISKEPVPPNFECPEGTDLGAQGCCVVRAPPVAVPNIVETIPPAWRCPIGGGRLSAESRTCLDLVQVSVEMICPPGTEPAPDGGCFELAEMIIPPPVEKCVRASYVCPDGQPAARGAPGLCLTNEVADVALVCPPDAALVGETCFRTTPAITRPPRLVTSVPVPVCPPGSIPRGTRCMMRREAEPLISCPEGHTLTGGICLQTLPVQSVCPPGTVPAEGGCGQDVFVPPRARVVQGCVHNVAPTCTGCPRAIASSCHRM